MIKNQIITLVKEHQNDFAKFNVKSIYLFGSVARDEDGPDSDVDILVSFVGKPTFDQYMDLKFFLESLFQRDVDLVTEEGLRPEMKSFVNQDLIRVA